MSKNIEATETKNVNAKPAKRGRPHKTLVLPETAKFTLTDVENLNPGIARLTIYNQINDGTLPIKATKETRPTGKPGKPGTIFITLAAWKRSQASKKAAKTRKANSATKIGDLAPVDLTPAAAPVADAPVAA